MKCDNMIILNSTDSDVLRELYIDAFIDVSSDRYIHTIKNMTECTDGWCYTGYLWDCLKKPRLITERRLNQFVQKRKGIYIMWDIHSKDYIKIPNYWKYPKDSVIHLEEWSKELVKTMPEDIYVFDDTFNWSAIYTHEDINSHRYCLFTTQ